MNRRQFVVRFGVVSSGLGLSGCSEVTGGDSSGSSLEMTGEVKRANLMDNPAEGSLPDEVSFKNLRGGWIGQGNYQIKGTVENQTGGEIVVEHHFLEFYTSADHKIGEADIDGQNVVSGDSKQIENKFIMEQDAQEGADEFDLFITITE